MNTELTDFFSLIGKAKKEKEDETRSLIGEIDIDSVFSTVKTSIEEDKKKKVKAEKQLKVLESWLYSEIKEEEVVEEEEIVEEVVEEKVVKEERPYLGPDETKYEELIEEELEEEAEEDDTLDHALKILDSIKSKEEVRENVTDPEIVRIRGELEYLKNLVNAQGGGGEVRLEFLDDVDRDSVKVDGKVLAYQASTGKFIGTTVTSSSSDVVGYAHTAGISTVSQGLTGTPDISVGILTATTANFTGNVTIGGTLTYEDVTNVDSIGIITARSGFGLTDGLITSASATTTTTSETTIDSFTKTAYRSAKYQVQVTRGSAYQVTEISIIHDGTNSYGTEYATIKTGESLSSFTTDINSDDVRLRATPTSSSSTTFKMVRTAIEV
tara:strand:- start:2794 stop:3942 length:1149 start_codon:yes stop_codon:yes gene_type:complete